jgi:CubicO group peptidase (beta-lactamase class C family)
MMGMRSWRAIKLALLALPIFFATPSPTRAAAAGPASASAGTDRHALTGGDLDIWLDGVMDYALKQADVAGAVVVVVKDGRILFKKGYGYSDVASHRPVDPDTTLFRPGSITKTFTFTAVMQLVETGKIDLDADINRYLDFRIAPYRGQPITMRNLMTHTAGFEDSLRDLYADPAKATPTIERFVKQQVPRRVFAPGTTTAYSNYGVTLAGYILQRVSGERWDDYIERHILRPLGMANATLHQPLPARLGAQMSSGYDLASGPAKPFEIIGVAPAGGSAVSGSDMAHYMIAHLQDGAYQGRRILRPATARAMHDTATTLISPAIYRFMLGFYERNRNGHRIIAHDGDSQWFHSNFLLYLDDKVGLFVSMNSRGQGGGSSLIREALYQQFSDRYFPAPVATPPARYRFATRDAAIMAGDYLSSRREVTTFRSLASLVNRISVETDAQGHLIVPAITGLNRRPETFEEVAPFVWQAINGQGRLAAKVVSGKVVMWTDDQNANNGVFLPIPPLENGRWIAPLLAAAVAVLLVAGLFWPMLAMLGHRSLPDERAATAWPGILVPITSVPAALLMIAWCAVITVRDWTSAMIPLVETLQILGMLAFPLAVVAAAWHVRVVANATYRHHALARLGTIVALAAATVLLWAAFACHLIRFTAAL